MDDILRKKEGARVGVFICHCGSNIGGVIDCKKLAERARLLPGVSYAEDNLYTCSEVGLSRIKEAITAHQLNRVVVASCTPRTHEPLFRATIQDAGLNPYLFEMANIREQCSWVHMKEQIPAFEKAWDLVKMGVAKAQLLDPLEKIRLDVFSSVAIIGGGIAGITSAINLGQQGFKVYLLEKEAELGGLVKNLHKLYPTSEDATVFLRKQIEILQQLPNVEIITGSTIRSVKGFVGNYDLEVSKSPTPKTIKVGAVILATGAQALAVNAVGSFQGEHVINQLDLEGQLRSGSVNAKNIVMIQCAGARNQDRPYCSSVCCGTALKNAILLKEMNPATNITILYRDIQTIGLINDKMYEKARSAGVLFIKYGVENLPVVKDSQVIVKNELLNQEVMIPRDLVVLSTPLVSLPDAKELAQFFKVPQDDQGFFLEAHVKLRPVDFATDGVYVCGSAKWPANISETSSQALAAAARASTILSHDFIEMEGSTAILSEDMKYKCHGCEVCVKVCSFNAIKKNEKDEIEIIRVLCKGCGTCGATCPERVISINGFSNDQIIAQIHALRE